MSCSFLSYNSHFCQSRFILSKTNMIVSLYNMKTLVSHHIIAWYRALFFRKPFSNLLIILNDTISTLFGEILMITSMSRSFCDIFSCWSSSWMQHRSSPSGSWMQGIRGNNQTTEGLGDQGPGPVGSHQSYIKSKKAKQPVALAEEKRPLFFQHWLTG